MNDKINQELHEKIMGECWHEKPNRHFQEYSNFCINCGSHVDNPSYTSNPSDYWKLLQKVKGNKEFLDHLCRKSLEEVWT